MQNDADEYVCVLYVCIPIKIVVMKLLKLLKVVTGVVLLINSLIISLVLLYSLMFSSYKLIGIKSGYFSLVGRLLFKENASFSIFLGLTAIAGVIVLSSIKEKE